MTPTYDKVHNRFKLNGTHFNHSELKEVAYSFIKEGELYEKVIGDFLIDWLNNNDYITVNTSGSTGKPKSIKVKKQAMVNSAIATGDFFELQPGDKALLCLPAQYIAGKMMLVRALILGLEIDTVAPSSQPIFNTKKHYDFCAMIPLQVENAIPIAIGKTHNIKRIIIGGAKVSHSLADKIKECSSQFFETYGMTETVTHVAVKQLASRVLKKDNYFKALPNVSFSKDDRECLIINAPKLIKAPLATNDIIELKSETSFKLLGRYDNVINSGGVKLYPEQIENKLQSVIDNRFFVASEYDETLGEKLILIIENSEAITEDISKKISALKSLDKFEKPKKIYTIKNFIETETGKIQRKKTIEALLG